MHRTVPFVIAILLAGSMLASAQSGPIGTTGGPNITFLGCMYYEHINFGGARTSIPGGVRRTYVGSAWNDKISSIACNPYCSLEVFEHRDLKGASRVFRGNISFVGDSWNDRISSMIASCNR
jgi:peptidase inhibitor family I36